jgi:hypothetical protein
MNNKKGFIATEIADFIAIIVFTVFVIVMFFLINISSNKVNIKISSEIEKEDASMNMRNILAAPVEYNGKNYTIGELISYLGSYPKESYSKEMMKKVVSEVSSIYEKANLTNADMRVYNKDGMLLFSIRRGQFYSISDYGSQSYNLSDYQLIACEAQDSSMILPRLDNDEYLKVEYQECVQ